jgi:hypothetical protein
MFIWNGTPPNEAKVGPFIMLLRNMDCKQELLNGTRLVVKGLQAHFVDAGITTSS